MARSPRGLQQRDRRYVCSPPRFAAAIERQRQRPFDESKTTEERLAIHLTGGVQIHCWAAAHSSRLPRALIWLRSHPLLPFEPSEESRMRGDATHLNPARWPFGLRDGHARRGSATSQSTGHHRHEHAQNEASDYIPPEDT